MAPENEKPDPDRDSEYGESAPIQDKDQTSFVDEKSPRGKQFGDGRKVADLGRVGSATPDTEPDDQPRRQRT
jgi:hypothetical protein